MADEEQIPTEQEEFGKEEEPKKEVKKVKKSAKPPSTIVKNPKKKVRPFETKGPDNRLGIYRLPNDLQEPCSAQFWNKVGIQH